MAQRILLGFSTSEGQTAKVAEHLARTMRAAGCAADVQDVADIPDSSLAGYDGVVLGASIHAGRHQRRMEEFARRHREELSRKPSAFFSLSLSASDPSEEHQRNAERCVQAFEQETGWKPSMYALFGGALLYTQYGFIKRFIMKRIVRSAGGPTDTSRDYELTRWESVDHFAEDFLRLLGVSPVQESQARASSPESEPFSPQPRP